jgi:hypothetical protein
MASARGAAIFRQEGATVIGIDRAGRMDCDLLDEAVQALFRAIGRRMGGSMFWSMRRPLPSWLDRDAGYTDWKSTLAGERHYLPADPPPCGWLMATVTARAGQHHQFASANADMLWKAHRRWPLRGQGGVLAMTSNWRWRAPALCQHHRIRVHPHGRSRRRLRPIRAGTTRVLARNMLKQLGGRDIAWAALAGQR